ncbi:hypothetical protein RYX36_001507 [Vicia faba]
MRIQSLILIVLVVIFSSAASNHAAFLNPNDPLVNEIGNFAVLNGVSEITSQGTNYRITLSATDGSTTKKYAAVVLDNPTQHVRKLTNFAPIKA